MTRMSDAPLHPENPELFVRTVRIEEPVELAAHVPAAVSAAWMRHGRGLVALGRAWEVRPSGAERFAQASTAYRELAARARVDDEVRTAASGLVALGSFSYADSSPRRSTLLVPEAVLGVDDGEAFLTVIGRGREPELPASWRDLFPSTPPSPARAPELEIDPDHTPEEYQELVRRAVAGIREGEAQKVVLSETTTVRSDAPVVRARLLAALARAYPSTWVYLVDDVIGASPEMLAQTEDGRLFSRVLAGTRSVADDGELDAEDRRAFLADPKERSEHDFARDSVTGRLDTVAAEVHASPEPFVLRLPGVEHLASDVTATLLPGVTSLDVAARLHPSAAVSGTPREAADAVIARLEARDRGGYASPVGWMDARGDGQWAIALRMAHLLDERTVRLQAGGGLVSASDPVSEHAETLAKCRPMLRALRGASG